MTQPAPVSPCINVCALDASGRTCMGCGRTIEEIARWGRMSAAEQWQVVARLGARERGPGHVVEFQQATRMAEG